MVFFAKKQHSDFVIQRNGAKDKKKLSDNILCDATAAPSSR